MYFTPGTCSSRLRTPLIASTLWLSNSTCINQPRHRIHALSARLRILIFVSVNCPHCIFQNGFLLKPWLLKVVNAVELGDDCEHSYLKNNIMERCPNILSGKPGNNAVCVILSGDQYLDI
jgi:hypothetical protein